MANCLLFWNVSFLINDTYVWEKILETIYSTFLTLVLFTFCTCCILRRLIGIVVSCFVCIVVVVLCDCFHVMCICCTMYVLLFLP